MRDTGFIDPAVFMPGWTPPAVTEPVAVPDLEHEYAEACLIAGRVGLAERLARYGIDDECQRRTEIIGVDRIMPAGRLFNPLLPERLIDRASRPEELWCITPVRYWDGAIANLCAWRPNTSRFYLRCDEPIILGAGVDQDSAGNPINPLDDSYDGPLVVYGSVSAWHRHLLGPGIVLLTDDLAVLGCTERVVTDDPVLARRMAEAGINARVIGETANAA